VHPVTTFQGASNALVLMAIRARQEGASIGMCGHRKVKNLKVKIIPRILIHVIDLKKVIYKGTKIDVALFEL
jgi:hypothetical protein